MLHYFPSIPANVSLGSLALLMTGRPAGETGLIARSADAGVHFPVLPQPSGRNPVADGSRGLLAMLLSEDNRRLLGLERHAEPTEFGPGTPAGARAGGAAPQPAGVALQAPPLAPAGHPSNRRQALAALKAFEAGRDARLPQLSAGGRQSAALAMGVVQFRNLADLLITFPCAVALPGEPTGAQSPVGSAGQAGVLSSHGVRYPGADGLAAAPGKACLGHREFVVARDTSNLRRIRYTHNLRQWQPTTLYTDTVVEAEKLAMWARILAEALIRAGAPPTPNA